MVEFANQESIASLHEAVNLPVVSNESVVPFKSRLLSLRSLGAAVVPNSQTGPKCKPQATIPLTELIQRLSKEESVSFTKDAFLMLHMLQIVVLQGYSSRWSLVLLSSFAFNMS